MQELSISQFKGNIEKYLGNLSKSGDILMISGSSEEDTVVIMPLKDYSALTETGTYCQQLQIEKRSKESMEQLTDNQMHRLDMKA